jgi:hypothetical protein
MRTNISVVFLAAIFVFGFVQEKRTTLAESSIAQDPVTEKDLDAILDEVSHASIKLKKVEEEMEKLKPLIIDYKRRLAIHNDHKCVFTEGDSEKCDGYEKERVALTEERDQLKIKFDHNVEQTGILKSNFGMIMARIRILTLLLYDCDCDEDQRPERAKQCWSECFEDANPGLKSCLDLPASAVAKCLERLRPSEPIGGSMNERFIRK